ncbi:hypothetical protein K2173_013964 [Erythroxylum novogranatense]|uniref:Late embryogenesis abundant protein LEA-2 subgroup domain-containing protein n=1 Tax=Erythroxylum novogranatense TaxID=1862640 RepID=A0AAV8SDD2_9ROSI|nr:hypothetical protein K2173_013964 [Erythroxylum novogranatense]
MGYGHCHDHSRKKLYRRILIGVGAIVVLVLFAIFLVWIILRPTTPEFVLQDTTLNAFNLSQACLLTTCMQITISTRNRNERIGIYYEHVDIYASYRNQQITKATELPRGIYMGQGEITVWSPLLNGNSMPISPYLAAVMSEDFNADIVLVNIKVSAKLKWKVGTWMSGDYHLIVNCPAYFTSSKQDVFPLSVGIKYPFGRSCSVEV